MTSTFEDVVDGVSTSTAVKAPVRCATTANITLSGFQTIDGVALTSADENLRVLVWNQTDATENGIYDAKSGTWERSADFDGARDVRDGTLVRITEGSTYAGAWFEVTTDDPITIGTTSLTFSTSTFPLDEVQQVNGMSALRGLSPTVGSVFLNYHTTAGDGGHGYFRGVTGASAGTYTDDGGITIVPTGGDGSAAWLRLSGMLLSDITFSIPSDYSTLQDALDELSVFQVDTGVVITLNIETGHALTAGFRVENGDFSNFRITSTDATVSLDAAFSAVSNQDLESDVPRSASIGFLGVNCRMPIWDIKVDTSAVNLATGLELDYGSNIVVRASKGVINTTNGASGGANVRVTTTSRLQGAQSIFTGGNGENVAVTLSSIANLQSATLTGAVNGACLDVSRGSYVHAKDADVSGGGAEGIYCRRSIVTAEGINVSNCVVGITSSHGSRVSALLGVFDGCTNDVKIEHGSFVDVTDATKSAVKLDPTDSIFGNESGGTSAAVKFNLLTGAGAITDEDNIGEETNHLSSQNTTSGQTVDFTDIPSWARKVIVVFSGVSTDGTTDDLLIQIGDSGGLETTGYNSTGNSYSASATTGAASTSGFVMNSSGSASNQVNGIMELINLTGNTWVSSHSARKNTTNVLNGGGAKALSATLDRIRVTLTGTPTDSFDNGAVNVRYER